MFPFCIDHKAIVAAQANIADHRVRHSSRIGLKSAAAGRVLQDVDRLVSHLRGISHPEIVENDST